MAAPEVIMATDRPGWCFENISKALVSQLADEFRFQIHKHVSLTKGSCDILVSTWWNHLLRLVTNLHPRAAIPCIYDAWSWRQSEVALKQFRLVLRHSTVLGVCNEGFIDLIREAVPAAELPEIFLIEDGVDTDLFSPVPLPGAFTVGWTGNSARQSPGDSQDAKGANLIRAACALAGVPCVMLDAAHATPWPHKDMPKFYEECTVYACMSTDEGTPNPPLEAAAMGRIPVSTPVGLMPQFIDHGKNGFLVERTPESLAKILVYLKSLSHGELQTLGTAARQQAERYSWKVKAEPWRRMLRRALQIAAANPNPGRPKPKSVQVRREDIKYMPAPPKPTQQVPAGLRELPKMPGPPTMRQRVKEEPPIANTVATRWVEPPPRPGKNRVLLISDQPDWAFRRNMLDLETYLTPLGMTFEHWMIADYHREGIVPRMEEFDAIFCVYHRWGVDELLLWDRTVGSLRGRWFTPTRPGAPTPADIGLVNSFRAFHVVTRQNFEELAPHCPNVCYLTNPVDMARHPEMTPPRDEMVCSWNGNAQHYVSGARDVKGFYSIIQPTMQRLAPMCRFIYAEYNTCKIPFEEMPAFYMKANVAICMSEYEGASNSTMEAMAAGQVLVTSDCGNHKEIQQAQLAAYGETGIFIIPRTAEALSRQLHILERDPKKLHALGQLNREEIKERWSWGAWAEKYKMFLETGMRN